MGQRSHLLILVAGAVIGGVVFWIGGHCELFQRRGSGGGSYDTYDDYDFHEPDRGSKQKTAAEAAKMDADPWGLWWAGLGACVGVFGGCRVIEEKESSPPYSPLPSFVVIPTVLVILTSLAISVAYGPILSARWPWLCVPIVVSLITCLAPFAEHWGDQQRPGEATEGVAVFYGVLGVPLIAFFVYPGTSALGLTSDRHMTFLIVPWQIIHGIGFSLVRHRIEKATQRRGVRVGLSREDRW